MDTNVLTLPGMDKKIKWFGFVYESLAAKMGSKLYGQKSEETLSAFTAWMVLTPDQRQRWRDIATVARMRCERSGSDFMDELRKLSEELGVSPAAIATPPGQPLPQQAPPLPAPLAAEVAKEVAKVSGQSAPQQGRQQHKHRRAS